MHISSKCSIAVHILLYIHQFSEQERVTSDLLSASSGCNPVTIRSLMSALKKGGIITVKAGTGGALLCRGPEDISLYDICTAADPGALQKFMGIHPSPDVDCPVGSRIHDVLSTVYQPLQTDLAESMKKITLASFLDALLCSTSAS